LIQVAEQLKLSPIRYVVNSHYHNDHVRGNQSFSPEVKILSTKQTAELMASEEPKSIAAEKNYGPARYRYFDSLFTTYKGDTTAREFQTIKMMRTYFGELSESYRKIRTRLPDTYVVKMMSLDGSMRKVRLVDEGAGHTKSDLILYLPNDSILFAGDLVFNKCHSYLGDGSTGGLKASLTKMESMPVRTVVPGHGVVGGRESIKAMREYVEDIETIMEKLKREGAGKEALKKVRVPETYRDWWLEEFFRENLEFAYDTMK
jgi:cyclase